jgi:hypothetical protein
MGTYEGNKKARGGGRGDIIQLINLHLLYSLFLSLFHIFKVKVLEYIP